MPNDRETSVPASASAETLQHVTTASEQRYGFFGTFNHSIDTKGRMIVPQNFREKLGNDIVVGVNYAQTAIAIFPRSVWQKRLDMLTELAEKDVRAEVFLEQFSMYSFDNCTFDMQGRILLPAVLRDLYLKDTQGVQISGSNNYIRVLPSDQAAQENEKFRREHPNLLEAISAIQNSVRDSGH